MSPPVEKQMIPKAVAQRFSGKIGDLYLAIVKLASFLMVLYFIYVFHGAVSRHRSVNIGEYSPPAEVGYKPVSASTDGDHQPTNVSHIVFGIGGSLATWGKRRRYSELWWKHGETRGFVWLDRKPKWWPKRSPPYRVSEDVSDRGYKGSASAVRLARIVLESYRLRWKDARWFVMGDDDTVFLSENLVSVLGQLDHTEMWYVGTSSESVEQALEHGFDMAYGGGDFALSAAAAEAIADATDGCLARYSDFYGSDGRVRACMSEMGVPLTRHPGFHQMDLRGDAYGLLAAHPIAPFVSLHHLDALKPLIPWKTQIESVAAIMEAARLDPAQALQQAFCYDPDGEWSISVSWGYTVQIYPSILPAYQLETALHTFRSWRGTPEGPFTFNTRPLPSDPCDQPAIFFLHQIENVSSSLTVSWYRRHIHNSKNVCQSSKYPPLAIHDVRVASFKQMAFGYKKAARRRCCDIKPSDWRGVVDVRLRNCGRLETITPPRPSIST